MKITKKQLEKLVESVVTEMCDEGPSLEEQYERPNATLENLKSMFRTLENYETKVAPKLFSSDVYLRQFQKQIKAAKLILDGEITILENGE